MKLAVRFVLLDAVGTLIYPDPPVVDSYYSAAHEHGSFLDKPEIAQRFREARVRFFENGSRSSETLERERWRHCVAYVFHDLPSTDALFEYLWQHFARPGNWRMFDDVATTWTLLCDSGIRLAIASNFDARLARICGELETLVNADRVFVSSEIGWSKPHREFYRHVIEFLRVEANQILMVGDDLERDFRAPQANGMRAVFLNRHGDRPVPNGVDPRQQIRSLSELPLYIQRISA